MFFTYLWNEIRRRRKQTFVVAMGLALGIALVISVSAMAAGVEDAQGTVLSSLYGVGTDMTVTQTVDQGDGGGPGFEIDQGGDEGFSRDRVTADPGQMTFEESMVSEIAGMDGVASAAGALSSTAVHIDGELPEFPTDGGELSLYPVRPPQKSKTGVPRPRRSTSRRSRCWASRWTLIRPRSRPHRSRTAAPSMLAMSTRRSRCSISASRPIETSVWAMP